MQPGNRVSRLLGKLIPDTADLEARLSLNETGPGVLASGPESIRSTSGWPGLLATLRRAIEEKRPVLVYGDYDVDGVVSTYLMFRWLRSQGVPGNCFIPSRLQHGYGLDARVIQQAAGQGYKTLLALDCGTANLDEIRQARKAGLDVAVIDHHEPKDELPDAALLNHHTEDNLEAFCTAGLVFHILGALRGELGGETGSDELELAGLATIADVVPLTHGNWSLAHHGLKALPETLNPGLGELIKVSKLHGLTRITGRQASFSLIPRLNAPGRMRSATLMLRMLQAADKEQGRRAAMQLETLNTERKRLSDQTARSALLKAVDFDDTSALALYDGKWHPGILGIVAARVAEQSSKPTVILGDAPQSEGILSGSVRTVGAIDVVAALGECVDSTVSFGGHSAAAGVKLEAVRLDEFREAWSSAVSRQLDNNQPVDATAGFDQLPEAGIGEFSRQFEDQLWALEPFGNGFPHPRCVLTGCRVERVSLMGRDKTHLNMLVTDGQRQVKIAGFNMSHLHHRLTPGQQVEPAVEIEPDNWNNRYSIVLRLIGLRKEYASQGCGQ